MGDALGLSRTFVAVTPVKTSSEEDLGTLEARLQALLARARHEQPTLCFQPEDFVRHLAARMPASKDPCALLEQVHAGELLLTYACAHADTTALALLDTSVFARVGAWFPAEDAERVAELKQRLRHRLLVAEGAPLPRIATYTGRGPLERWVRAVATRLLADLHAEVPRHVALDALPSDADALVGGDAELSFIRARHQEDFRECLQEALATLSPRERGLLRLHHVDNLSVDSVGLMYQTSRSTAARWIAQAREQLVERTRDALVRRLRLAPAELESLLALIRSQLEVSLHRLLRP
ncbi:RNA polymerase subunit sigma-70 [Myxococcus sp. XM-1-1-1]|uniref:sigma factor-like helix-turn-helix DNA-binding protein n=1 Tax=Myxococcus sp. XM-1-1-1 TaxID=2874602 RepID=UPI001CBA9664|nr:sigma factor-like helix-turn-helix DNA-binding protein [Myxococcus sp. XM-1-1-1]MBZ4408895.1 RNA polymerase subunit sigma-70 [Myxococcus sp. XM-1-1-1]